MVNEKRENVKELAERIKMERFIADWVVDEAAEHNAIDRLHHLEKTCRRVYIMDLDARAQINCMEQFVNIMCPYEDFEDAYVDDIMCDINEWVGNQFYFDKNGDWYDEGRKVR